MGKLDKPVLELLRNSSQSLTLAEISQELDQPTKKIYKTLRRLFEKGQIEAKGRRYTIVEE